MTTSSELFKQIVMLRKEGRVNQALGLLKDAIGRGGLGPEEIDRAGRFIQKARADNPSAPETLRVHLLGQCTTSWLLPALTAVAWGQGQVCSASEGGYDSVLQDISRMAAEERATDVVVLIPWTQRLFGGAGSTGDRVEDELAFWRHAWEAAGRMGARVLQVGYDWMTPGAEAYGLAGEAGTAVALVRAANAALRQNRPPGSYFLDLELVSGMMGRDAFYDPRRYHWTKQPFSEHGTVRLAEHLWAGARALVTGPKKVLVLDLDNTLWGGVVGETGPLGIALGESADGEAYRAFQKHVKALSKRGIVLAVASKNNSADGIEPFEKNPEMILRLDDIAAAEINWEPKGTTIRRIAETLNLGLDSFVFFDDNPAEREQVRQAIPEIAVADVPSEPAEYVRALEAGLWFETTSLTDEDRVRAEQYAVERKRRDLQQAAGTMEDYLCSLEMRADVREIDEADLMRVVQLLAKTNQFNLTTRRHTRDELLRLLGQPKAIGLTFRVEDRFGDHGLIGVMIGVPVADVQDVLKIDTWLMSCRVIGRTVEEFSFGELLGRARSLGFREIHGEYKPTKKNALVSELYDRMGFRRSRVGEDQAILYVLEVDGAARPTAYLSRKELASRVESAHLVGSASQTTQSNHKGKL
jgi:FkbH-like protein